MMLSIAAVLMCATVAGADILLESDYTSLVQVSVSKSTKAVASLHAKASFARHKKPMLWLHIHKAAGTTICHLARDNGENVVQPSINCNWEGKDQRLNFMDAPSVTCAERAKFFRDAHFTFGAIERELYNGSYCPSDFDYGVMLRRPLDLFISLLDYRPELHSTYRDTLRCLSNNSCPPVRRQTETGDWVVDNLWAYLDNFVVRLLLGPKGIKVPIGGITYYHFKKAADVLSTFQVVTFLEDLSTRSTKEMFASRLGWDSGVDSTHANSNLAPKKWALSQDEMDLVTNRTKWDLRLYNLFRGAASRRLK